MKKFLLCSLLSSFIIGGLNYSSEAQAKQGNGNLPPGQAKKLLNNERIILSQPQVIVNPNTVIYSVPMVNLNTGSFYFKTQPSAYISAKKARRKGYRTKISFINNLWVVQIR